MLPPIESTNVRRVDEFVGDALLLFEDGDATVSEMLSATFTLTARACTVVLTSSPTAEAREHNRKVIEQACQTLLQVAAPERLH